MMNLVVKQALGVIARNQIPGINVMNKAVGMNSRNKVVGLNSGDKALNQNLLLLEVKREGAKQNIGLMNACKCALQVYRILILITEEVYIYSRFQYG